jgi:DNA-binding transcriptional MerR regulator/methylmalonyl-CoA mutase cobalamin-binding subunit
MAVAFAPETSWRLRSWRYLPFFGLAAARAVSQTKKAPGLRFLAARTRNVQQSTCRPPSIVPDAPVDADLIPRHPIRVVARRTGLTAATIRAWERRYGAVIPVRSEGGQRLYTDRDVMRLDALRRLTEAGRSISAVATLSPAEATTLLTEDEAAAAASDRIRISATEASSPDHWTGQAYARVRGLDDAGLDRTLRRALATLGAHRFLVAVAAPLLRQIGAGWHAGDITPAQEHLGSAVVDRILAEIAAHSVPNDGSRRMVVATLQGELHALGARLVAAVVALEGWRVSYLGADLPAAEIAAAATAVGADAVAISMVAHDAFEAQARELVTLRAALAPEIDLLVGGNASGSLDPATLPGGVISLRELDDLRTYLIARR